MTTTPTGAEIIAQQRRARAAQLARWDRGAKRVVLLLALAVVAPFAAWLLTPARPLAALVVDKTVSHQNYREHAALLWWLTHRKRTGPAGARWRADSGYLGYDPVRLRGAFLDSAALAGRRLVYVADAYGVYSGDYADQYRAAALEHSDLIYGGINPAEAAALERFSRAGGAVVAEFNTLETPTWNTAASPVLARVVGARYEGWLGRWYADLASEDEVPRWMRERWRRRTGSTWAFRGEGLVVFGEVDDRLVVLTAEQLARPFPVTVELDRPDDPLVRGVRGGTPYWYWMSGVAPTESAEVLASFQLHLDSAGRALLREQRFPERFPAIVRRRGEPLGAYLAGDFADVGSRLPALQRTRFLDGWRRWLAYQSGPRGSMDDAFWNVATPVWENVMRTTADSPSRPR